MRYRHALALMLMAGMCVGFLALADEASEQEVFAIDYSTRTFVQAARSPALEGVMHGVSGE